MIVIHPSKVQIMSLVTNILAYKTSEADTSVSLVNGIATIGIIATS